MTVKVSQQTTGCERGSSDIFAIRAAKRPIAPTALIN